MADRFRPDAALFALMPLDMQAQYLRPDGMADVSIGLPRDPVPFARPGDMDDAPALDGRPERFGRRVVGFRCIHCGELGGLREPCPCRA